MNDKKHDTVTNEIEQLMADIMQSQNVSQANKNEFDAARKVNVGKSILLISILTAVFGSYFALPNDQFYPYIFLGFSLILMFIGTWYIEAPSRQMEVKTLPENDVEKSESALEKSDDGQPESANEKTGGKHIHRIK